MSEYTYYTAAETAKLIRAQLKKNFPDTKFYIRSKTYSGGASIDIDWVNGPTDNQVKIITNAFNGAEFDGMADMKSNNEAYLLPDGSAAFATYSQNAETEIKYTSPHPQAKLVHFGADFIFTNRYYTADKVQTAMKTVCERWRIEEPEYHLCNPGFGTIETCYWDCRDPKFGTNDYHINNDARELLDVDMSQSPAIVKVDPQLTEQEAVTISYDREWTWITFQQKPSEATREILKNRFNARFSGKRTAWYVCETIDENTIRLQLA